MYKIINLFNKKNLDNIENVSYCISESVTIHKNRRLSQWINQKKKPELIPGKVTVTGFMNGWCPAQSLAFERARRAALELGDMVVFQQIDTFERKDILEWGLSNALFIDDKEVQVGPPPSYEKIKKAIARKVKKL